MYETSSFLNSTKEVIFSIDNKKFESLFTIENLLLC